ncbi:MAG: hypothetical protein RLZZ552_865, partial [Verrucomicrobiota bacterium]
MAGVGDLSALSEKHPGFGEGDADEGLRSYERRRVGVFGLQQVTAQGDQGAAGVQHVL